MHLALLLETSLETHLVCHTSKFLFAASRLLETVELLIHGEVLFVNLHLALVGLPLLDLLISFEVIDS